MNSKDKPDDVQEAKTAFEEEAEAGQEGILSEFLYFLMNNKKWWLTPIILVLALVAILVAFSSTAAAPFIYTLF